MAANQPKKILMLDGDEFIRQTFSYVISDELKNVEIYEYENGDQALEAVGEVQPDLIITDVIHPGLNGIDFTHAVREKWGKRPPILILSAVLDISDRGRKATEAGANAILQKGSDFDVQEYLEIVKILLGLDYAEPDRNEGAEVQKR